MKRERKMGKKLIVGKKNTTLLPRSESLDSFKIIIINDK